MGLTYKEVVSRRGFDDEVIRSMLPSPILKYPALRTELTHGVAASSSEPEFRFLDDREPFPDEGDGLRFVDAVDAVDPGAISFLGDP